MSVKNGINQACSHQSEIALLQWHAAQAVNCGNTRRHLYITVTVRTCTRKPRMFSNLTMLFEYTRMFMIPNVLNVLENGNHEKADTFCKKCVCLVSFPMY